MSRTSFVSCARRASGLVLVVGALGVCGRAVATNGLHFYADDPIAREPESQDASKAQPYFMGSLYEMTTNLFVTARYKPSGTRARNINTIDEVPNSSWFTNRIGADETVIGSSPADKVRGHPAASRYDGHLSSQMIQ
jgi:hypothetical protein